MTDFFEQAFAYMLANEGIQYINDPADSGGPTKFGITKKTYENYLLKPVSELDMQHLDLQTAKSIYRKFYWDALNLHSVSQIGIAICIFDTGVLYGTKTAAITAQKAAVFCGATLKFDGLLGDKSVGVLNILNQREFLGYFRGLIIERIFRIISENPKNVKYQVGWLNRANKLETLSSVIPVGIA